MKKFVIILTISIAVLFAGCVSEEGSYEESKISEKSISSPLDIVPKSSEKVVYTKTEGFVDLLGENSEIVNAYKELIGKYGLSVDDIEYTIQADNTYVLKGYGLDEYKFMDELGLDYKEEKYNGANMLINENHNYAVAKYKNYLIHGNTEDVKRVIDTIKGDYPSITEKKEIKDMLSKVDDDYVIANIGRNYKGYYGAFIYLKGRNVEFDVVAVYNDVDDAKEQYEYVKEELEDELDNGNIKDYDIDRDGNIVVAKVIMSKEEFLGDYANKLGLNFGNEIKYNTENEYNTQTKEKSEFNHDNTNKVNKNINLEEPYNLIPNVFWASYVDVGKFSKVVKGKGVYDELNSILKCYGLSPDDVEFYMNLETANLIKTDKLTAKEYLKKLGYSYNEEYYGGATLLVYTTEVSDMVGKFAATNYKGYFIFGLKGGVEKVIDAINGKNNLVTEDENIREIINEMPKGYFAFKLYNQFDADGGEFYYDEGDKIVIKGLWICIDDEYAKKRKYIIENDYENYGYTDYNIEVDGNRVTTTLTIDKDEFGEYDGYTLVSSDWIGLKKLENCENVNEEEENQINEEQQTNVENEQQTEQQFENEDKETNTYELPLTWKELEVAGMDGVMFDFGNKKVTFEDWKYSPCEFRNPIIIDGNKIWCFGFSGGEYGYFTYNDNMGFDADVDDIILIEMPYNVKAVCDDFYGAGWFIEDDNGKLHHVIFDCPKETIMDKTGNVEIDLAKIKKDVVVANVDVDELMAGAEDNKNNYKIVIGWKGNKLYLITMEKDKFEDWAYNSKYEDGFDEPFPPVQIKEFEFNGNIIDARSDFRNYIIVATENGLYIITVYKREPDEFKITDSLKTNIECYAFDTGSGLLVYYDGSKVYYTDIKIKSESDNSDIYYIARNYEGGLNIDGVTGLSICHNYNWLGTQVEVAGDGWIKTYNIEFEAKKDAEGNSVYDENGNSIYIVKFEPKNVYYDEIYDKYYSISVPFAGKYIYRGDSGDSKNGRVEFRVYTTNNKLYLFGTNW
ncbi:hypothetical protein [Methanocaldococcus jannaschii]|nr:hypothetical protein [Methanocaldococcus jannaschii]